MSHHPRKSCNFSPVVIPVNLLVERCGSLTLALLLNSLFSSLISFFVSF
ncbi:hypothetical protein E2C01_040235 [Portunus trituberculatus]|uniref:Uncharacterized protein n=1 Tax=Portunus trituberculatus TaxID=210409 RepID=A0A5B7FM38_PORTR|nr:hypothetical protein [Portunus trituberculatus]